ncbi:Transcriptional regulatory protein FixJ [Pseudobythopirellula maris]|uniref:Transcriptional regulatory protein FixJ n=2 Tax=Pseudobythopirellula maris TaxID=2527991 RepID=A0A5C5ZKI1_9BACT|nr:Transcriptional regulatory protein FixJ [Pseudobythopirellula maris]
MVYVVDADEGVRRSTESLVESLGFGCDAYSSGEQYLEACETSGPVDRPACVVLGHLLAGSNGIELLRRIGESPCPPPVIARSGFFDLPLVVSFMEGVAVTVVEDPVSPSQLGLAIHEAIEADRKQVEMVTRLDRLRNAVALLSEREKAVIEKISEGLLNRSIARVLKVSERTIEGDRAKIIKKLGAVSSSDAIAKYAQYRVLNELIWRNGSGAHGLISGRHKPLRAESKDSADTAAR